MSKCQLAPAKLASAQLTPTNLTSAELTPTHLRRAELTSAQLTPTNLTSAQLMPTQLTQAHLTHQFTPHQLNSDQITQLTPKSSFNHFVITFFTSTILLQTQCCFISLLYSSFFLFMLHSTKLHMWSFNSLVCKLLRPVTMMKAYATTLFMYLGEMVTLQKTGHTIHETL